MHILYGSQVSDISEVFVMVNGGVKCTLVDGNRSADTKANVIK